MIMDGLQIQDGHTGAAYYYEDSGDYVQVRVKGGHTAPRAELSANTAAALNAPTPTPLQLYTDSLTSPQPVNNWVHTPWTLDRKHRNRLCTFANGNCCRTTSTHFCKIRACTNMESNELADLSAKLCAETGDTSNLEIQYDGNNLFDICRFHNTDSSNCMQLVTRLTRTMRAPVL